MIDLYHKYYLSKEKIDDILTNGIIVFDTSAILDLYYYSHDTQEEIYNKLFPFLEHRLWIPAQVYYEFLKNKDNVASKPVAAYERLLTKSNKDGGYVNAIVEKTQQLQNTGLEEIKNQLKTLKEQTIGNQKHPNLSSNIYTEIDNALALFENSLNDFTEQTKAFKTKITDSINNIVKNLQASISPDNVHNAIDHNFMIGKEYPFSKMMELSQEGKIRYDEEIPPGYEDGSEKEGIQKYGDWFAWKQILEHASSQKKDFLLVTNDVKNDWFEKDKKTPRFELLREFHDQAGKSIWLYSMKDFIYQINTLLTNQIQAGVLKDIDSVQEEKENSDLVSIPSIDDIQFIFDYYISDSVYVIDFIPLNESLRLFDQPLLIEAENESGQAIRITLTLIRGGNYAKALHGMTNAFEIKKHYEANDQHYFYYNFIIASNKSVSEKLMEHTEKTKVRKLLANRAIKSAICYINNEQRIEILKANYNLLH